MGKPEAPEELRLDAKVSLFMNVDRVLIAEDAALLENTLREHDTVTDRRLTEVNEMSAEVHELSDPEPHMLPLLVATIVEKAV